MRLFFAGLIGGLFGSAAVVGVGLYVFRKGLPILTMTVEGGEMPDFDDAPEVH